MQKTNEIVQSVCCAETLRYTLVVEGSAYGSQSAYCAYQFALTLLTNSRHVIQTIFFYANGVYNANVYTSPANDEFNLVVAWQSLNQKYKVPLAVCVSAAQRRGIKANNLAPQFELTGLGQLSEAIAISDRVIQF